MNLLHEHEKKYFKTFVYTNKNFKELHYYPILQYFINIIDGKIIVDTYYEQEDNPTHLIEKDDCERAPTGRDRYIWI